MVTRAPSDCSGGRPKWSMSGRSAQEHVILHPLRNLSPEAAILASMAASAKGSLLVWSLRPFKWWEQWSHTAPKGKIRLKLLLLKSGLSLYCSSSELPVRCSPNGPCNCGSTIAMLNSEWCSDAQFRMMMMGVRLSVGTRTVGIRSAKPPVGAENPLLPAPVAYCHSKKPQQKKNPHWCHKCDDITSGKNSEAILVALGINKTLW